MLEPHHVDEIPDRTGYSLIINLLEMDDDSVGKDNVDTKDFEIEEQDKMMITVANRIPDTVINAKFNFDNQQSKYTYLYNLNSFAIRYYIGVR